jgi:acetolactate synthase-1/2/3 large subunit
MERYDLTVTALGGFGAFVTSKDELDAALSQAIASKLPACINVAMIGLPAPTF